MSTQFDVKRKTSKTLLVQFIAPKIGAEGKLMVSDSYKHFVFPVKGQNKIKYSMRTTGRTDTLFKYSSLFKKDIDVFHREVSVDGSMVDRVTLRIAIDRE